MLFLYVYWFMKNIMQKSYFKAFHGNLVPQNFLDNTMYCYSIYVRDWIWEKPPYSNKTILHKTSIATLNHIVYQLVH